MKEFIQNISLPFPLISMIIFAQMMNIQAQVTITSDGKLGLGTSQPNAVLDIKGNIHSDSSIYGKTIFTDQLIVGSTILNGDNLIGFDATLLGNVLINSCNVITSFSALSGNFTLDVSANSGDFITLDAFSGSFDGDVSIGQNLLIDGQLQVENLYTQDTIQSLEGVFTNLKSTDVFIAQEGIFEDKLYIEKGAIFRDTSLIEGIFQTENEIEFAIPQAYTYNLSALQFNAQGPFTSNPWIKKENYGYLYQAGSDSLLLNASLNLPDEYIIKKVSVLFVDNSPNHNIDSFSIAIKSIPKEGIPSITTEFQDGFNSYDNFLSNEIQTNEFLLPENGIEINNIDNMYYINCDYRVTNNNANDLIRFYGLSIEYEVRKIKGI